MPRSDVQFVDAVDRGGSDQTRAAVGGVGAENDVDLHPQLRPGMSARAVPCVRARPPVAESECIHPVVLAVIAAIACRTVDRCNHPTHRSTRHRVL